MVLKRIIRRRRRKYPIKRDDSGRSARQRCFEMFEDTVPREDIARAVGVPISTVSKYHQQWKKHSNLDKQIAYLKGLLKKDSEVRERTIDLWSKAFMIPREELETIIHQPNGIKRILTRKIYFPAYKEADDKRFISLQLALLLTDHLIKEGGKFEEVYQSLRQLLAKNKRLREDEDEETKQGNKTIAMMRGILEPALNDERRRRQPDRLSPDEIDAIMSMEPSVRARRAETRYWHAIKESMQEGLTEEEAREGMYQDLLKYGEPADAEALRRYQDRVHPARPSKRPGNQTPPSDPARKE